MSFSCSFVSHVFSVCNACFCHWICNLGHGCRTRTCSCICAQCSVSFLSDTAAEQLLRLQEARASQPTANTACCLLTHVKAGKSPVARMMLDMGVCTMSCVVSCHSAARYSTKSPAAGGMHKWYPAHAMVHAFNLVLSPGLKMCQHRHAGSYRR